MSKRKSCENTDYTDGFKIHRENDGTFVATKGEQVLKAKSAKEIDEQIKNIAKPKAAEKQQETGIHEQCVRTIAEDLKRGNWLVKANTEGYEKPQEIHGVTPDVVAHKGCLKQICHIVSEKDFKGDEANYRDFKNYCKEYDFHLYVVNKDGKPIQTKI